MSKNFIRVEPDVVQAVGIGDQSPGSGDISTPAANAELQRPCAGLLLQRGALHVAGLEQRLVPGECGRENAAISRSEYIRQHYWVGSDKVATIQTPNNTGLNLRTGPGTGSHLPQAVQGRKLRMWRWKRAPIWWKVSVDGYVGFMSASFLRGPEVIKPSFSTGSSTPSQNKGYGIVTNPRSSQPGAEPAGERLHHQQGDFPARATPAHG